MPVLSEASSGHCENFDQKMKLRYTTIQDGRGRSCSFYTGPSAQYIKFYNYSVPVLQRARNPFLCGRARAGDIFTFSKRL